MHPKHLLVLAEGQLGDLLLLTPALRAIKQASPSTTISLLVLDRHGVDDASSPVPLPHVLASAANHVLAANPSVDHLFVYHRSTLRRLHGWARLRAEAAMIRWLRMQKADAVVVTFAEDRFVTWALLSGARVRIGQAGQPLARLLTHPVAARKDQAGVLAYYCLLAAALGAHCSDARTQYDVPKGARERADAILEQAGIPGDQRPVAVHPGASGDYKIWPPDRYAQLIAHLQDRNVPVVLLEGEQDREIVQAIVKELRSGIPVVHTGSDLAALAAVFQRSALCITNDSGPRHLAVAVGAPSLALFRQHHDREWRVYEESPTCRTLKSGGECPACPAGECKDQTPDGERFGSYCMRMITVEEAVEAVRGMLERG